MSLLLDARKKLQQAKGHATSADELRLEEHPVEAAKAGAADDAHKAEEAARGTGQNLFAAKSASPGRALPNPKLLLALGGTVLLLAGGMTYLWYVDSASSTAPLRPVAPPPRPMQPAAMAESARQSAPEPAKPQPAVPERAPPAAAAPAKNTPLPQPRVRAPARPDNSPVRIEQQKIEPVDPLLRDAYLAYGSGRLDEAQQLYLAMLQKDARNPDVLLGLAAIAQQRGEAREAAQYFGRVLVLDPRNAAANAGMSALGTDDDYSESRLKMLLREQGNSAALHSALGNLYAGQSRWGEAQQAYFNAYTLESGNAEYAFNLAVSLDHLGQGKLAAQHYQRAIQLDPSHSAGFDHAQISRRAQELLR